jgi:hypothetical protein
MASVFCFESVAAISNRFGITIRIGLNAATAGVLTEPYMYCLGIVQNHGSRRLAGRQERVL